MQGIQISLHKVGAKLDITLVMVSGYIDTTTCHELADVFQKLIDRERYMIIVDLGGVSYISSAGWGVFMGDIKKIRELSGDVKIVQMSPEIFEVFEMLEFNRIINHYESVEEAIDEYDIIRGIDITNPDEAVAISPEPDEIETQFSASPEVFRPPAAQEKREILKKELPVLEKIKRVVVDDPTLGVVGISQKLRTEEYGGVSVNWFKMYRLLRQLNLENREKRHRFYRSR